MPEVSEEAIRKIKQQLMNDPRNTVFTQQEIPPVYQIHPQAKILIIGQAPGKKVSESHIPFADKSGETLMSWMSITKEIFYSDQIAIMPMDFYYPGKGKSGDLPPRKFIAQEYHQALLSLMPQVQMTLLIGKYAIDYYLGKRAKRNLTETVRHYEDYLPQYFPLVHPSPLNFRWQAKNPWFQEEIVPQLRVKIADALA